MGWAFRILDGAGTFHGMGAGTFHGMRIQNTGWCCIQSRNRAGRQPYIVDTDTLKLFFNAHIKSHIDYASVVWGGCIDANRKVAMVAFYALKHREEMLAS